MALEGKGREEFGVDGAFGVDVPSDVKGIVGAVSAVMKLVGKQLVLSLIVSD
jgi:hypothetical protein